MCTDIHSNHIEHCWFLDVDLLDCDRYKNLMVYNMKNTGNTSALFYGLSALCYRMQWTRVHDTSMYIIATIPIKKRMTNT